MENGLQRACPDTRPLFAFQTFDYLRAFFNNRTPWARLNFMLCAAGAFQLWRRDLVEELGGWSATFTCEDIEFTFRVHRTLRERGRDYRIASLPDCIGVTEGPDSVRNLVSQRERWQRVILETCWANRRMWFNPRYGTVGLLGVPTTSSPRSSPRCSRSWRSGRSSSAGSPASSNGGSSSFSSC